MALKAFVQANLRVVLRYIERFLEMASSCVWNVGAGTGLIVCQTLARLNS